MKIREFLRGLGAAWRSPLEKVKPYLLRKPTVAFGFVASILSVIVVAANGKTSVGGVRNQHQQVVGELNGQQAVKDRKAAVTAQDSLKSTNKCKELVYQTAKVLRVPAVKNGMGGDVEGSDHQRVNKLVDEVTGTTQEMRERALQRQDSVSISEIRDPETNYDITDTILYWVDFWASALSSPDSAKTKKAKGMRSAFIEVHGAQSVLNAFPDQSDGNPNAAFYALIERGVCP